MLMNVQLQYLLTINRTERPFWPRTEQDNFNAMIKCTKVLVAAIPKLHQTTPRRSTAILHALLAQQESACRQL